MENTTQAAQALDTVFEQWSSCEMYGHNFVAYLDNTKFCLDCGCTEQEDLVDNQ